MAFPGTKHGPRRRPYRVRWGNNYQHTETVTAAEWQRARADGWITPVENPDGSLSDRVARVAGDVIATLRNGVLWLRNKIKKTFYKIYTSWIAVERAAPHRGEYYQRDLERFHCGPRIVKSEPDGNWLERCDWRKSLEKK